MSLSSSSTTHRSRPSWWPASSCHWSTTPYLRPLGAAALEGLAVVADRLWVLDRIWGYLLQLDPDSGYSQILNPHLALELRDTYALATHHCEGDTWLWFAKDQHLFRVSCRQIATAQRLQDFYQFSAPYPIESLAIQDQDLYATCYQREKILKLDLTSGQLLQEFAAPGVGREHLAIQADVLWISDRVEETLYVVDRQTGEELARILTPFPSPTGIAFWQGQVLVAYATEEAYIRDNPNDPDPLSVSMRDKTFISPLRLRSPQTPSVQPDAPTAAQGNSCPILFYPQMLGSRAGYTLSAGYRVELTYLEELAQQEPRQIPNLVWKIALPCHSLRQRVQSISAIGHPFQVESYLGQQMAVFDLGTIAPEEARLFGWKAVLDLYSIKYHVRPADVENAVLPTDLACRYLLDDDDLAMHTPIIEAAARTAIGTETNMLRKMLKIREFVYDKLSYRVTPYIETPDKVLRRGTGSCGEYVGLLLALARLNGIACRTVGRYKCPPHPELKQIPLFPDYNHVWIEFYLPGWGWVPMESNPDDLGSPPYPQRYFMGLPWTHAEIAKGITFETCSARDLSIGELAINHVQFRILEEL